MSQYANLVRSALDAAELPIPDAVTTAEAFDAAAAELRATLAAKPAPELAAATAATAAKLVNAYAEHAALQPLRLAAVDELTKIAAARVQAAWAEAAQRHRADFAAAFDKLGVEFGNALDARPGIKPETVEAYRLDPQSADVFTLAYRLDALASIRDEYAAQTYDRTNGTYSDTFERLSRHLRVLDRRGTTNTPDTLAPHLAARGPAHWITAHQSPWFQIAWQELPEQRANVVAITAP